MRNPFLSLILALIHGGAGLTILLVASWFIAASAVAGPSFNYVLPAVAIRAFALLRISSGYGEMWLSHHQLLNKLAKLRLTIFKNLDGQPENLRALETDKLHYQSQDLASVWVGWVHQNASAILSMLLISALVLLFMPSFSLTWFGFVIWSLGVYSWLMFSGISTAKLKLADRARLESDIEHHIDSAQIWHMMYSSQSPDCSSFYNIDTNNKHQIEKAFSLLLFGSLLCVVLLLSQTNNLVDLYIITPLYLVLPMAFLAATDWFGRVFYTQDRLQDYLTSKANLSALKYELSVRNNEKITTLQLTDFNVATAKQNTVNVKVTEPSLTLLTGASGSGKSRFMMAMAGLLPHIGKKWINHEEIASNSIISDIAYIEQHPYCLSGTLRQNLLIANEKASDALLVECLSSVGLGYLSNLGEWVGTGGRVLSGGELKRLGLARALLSHQSFILLDEPFEALDEANVKEIVIIINKLKQTKKLIVASHVIPSDLQVDSLISLEKNVWEYKSIIEHGLA
ncbi:ATP-binding cassette domain-containing protein [Thalassotalea sediminis]|uniref:ATP-binding cassette domain-containing protein n=1 Tax=Thalassotalea sediminis TaxID=1759089 RepID=UPI00257433F1|nr:ATP-binding cassette domain-containing protein [Thalassotalea sediminis]